MWAFYPAARVRRNAKSPRMAIRGLSEECRFTSVRACLLHDRIHPPAADERVHAGAAGQRLVADRAGDRVGVAAADDALEVVVDLVELARRAVVGQVVQREEEAVGAAGVVAGVEPGTADEAVG